MLFVLCVIYVPYMLYIILYMGEKTLFWPRVQNHTEEKTAAEAAGEGADGPEKQAEAAAHRRVGS